MFDDGRKYWRFRYWQAGKEKALSVGVYPAIGLKAARRRRDAERKHLDDKLDPSAERRAANVRVTIAAAARAAQAHDFIAALPHAYDTVVGDRGVRLSGGQQQRLALARALLKDPRILILDEATTMFDPEGERDFLEACRGLLRSRTVLLITHRPAPLTLASRTIRLCEGRLLASAEVSRDAGQV